MPLVVLMMVTNPLNYRCRAHATLTGNRVWANPRAVVAMMRQCNTVDLTRRSPSYEVRLAKYSGRAYEVYVPTLRREEIDPTVSSLSFIIFCLGWVINLSIDYWQIYERSIARMEGLARLLVLEKLTDTDTRYAFLTNRRNLRGRPNPLNRYNKRTRKHKGDLKVDSLVGGLEMNDYDVQSLHIPYGPGWDARRIERLVYQTVCSSCYFTHLALLTDFFLPLTGSRNELCAFIHFIFANFNSNLATFNPKNKGRRLHRHPAFFGTMDECLEDCCEVIALCYPLPFF